MRPVLALLLMFLSGCTGGAILGDLDTSGSASEEQTAKAPDPASGDKDGRPLVTGADTSIGNQQTMGDQLAAQALDRTRRSEDRALEAQLNAIVARIEASLPHAERQFKYRVYLIEHEQPNAFTPGGGHIFVTTGLVKRLRTEGQMAMVLAHEMAHNTQAHVVKGQNGRDVSRRIAAFGKRVFTDNLGVPWISAGVGALARTGLGNYTRVQEEAADAKGLEYMVAAGYDPREAPRSFAALMQVRAQKKTIYDMLEGYPTGLTRAEQINAIVHARYHALDLSTTTATTPEYERLTARYHDS